MRASLASCGAGEGVVLPSLRIRRLQEGNLDWRQGADINYPPSARTRGERPGEEAGAVDLINPRTLGLALFGPCG